MVFGYQNEYERSTRSREPSIIEQFQFSRLFEKIKFIYKCILQNRSDTSIKLKFFVVLKTQLFNTLITRVVTFAFYLFKFVDIY